jgi:SAM-dependent methyltransferase
MNFHLVTCSPAEYDFVSSSSSLNIPTLTTSLACTHTQEKNFNFNGGSKSKKNCPIEEETIGDVTSLKFGNGHGNKDALDRFLDKKNYLFQELQERKRWYSVTAEAYLDYRPYYPDVILDDALKTLNGTRVLEIGSGPGTATISLVKRGFHVSCLEPNPDFCSLAQERWKNEFSHTVTIRNIAFEEAIIQESEFDAVIAATSMHWIPADVAFPKAARALKSGGTLIMLWNMMLTPASSDDYLKLKLAHGKDFENLLAWSNEDTQKNIANAVGDLMMTSGYFEGLRTMEVRQTVTYTAAQYLGLLSTYSFYIRLSWEDQVSIFERIRQTINVDLGGIIELSFVSLYHAAIKKS